MEEKGDGPGIEATISYRFRELCPKVNFGMVDGT